MRIRNKYKSISLANIQRSGLPVPSV
uniref:Uncharacterized protein n=1 Tax=Anguilla anguilla TaxID=7936 RepID=A0A0E9Q2F3_ANGAN